VPAVPGKDKLYNNATREELRWHFDHSEQLGFRPQ
jgi:hypothetical protein